MIALMTATLVVASSGGFLASQLPWQDLGLVLLGLLLLFLARLFVLRRWRNENDPMARVPLIEMPTPAPPGQPPRPAWPPPNFVAHYATERTPAPTPAAALVPIPEAMEEVRSGMVRFHRPPEGTLQLLPGRLEIVSGKEDVDAIRFMKVPGREPVVTFGRSPGEPHTHIELQSPTVSRKHAAMRFQDGSWHIVNLSTTNPVVVHGRELTVEDAPVRLEDGDHVEMGEVRFRFHGPPATSRAREVEPRPVSRAAFDRVLNHAPSFEATVPAGPAVEAEPVAAPAPVQSVAAAVAAIAEPAAEVAPAPATMAATAEPTPLSVEPVVTVDAATPEPVAATPVPAIEPAATVAAAPVEPAAVTTDPAIEPAATVAAAPVEPAAVTTDPAIEPAATVAAAPVEPAAVTTDPAIEPAATVAAAPVEPAAVAPAAAVEVEPAVELMDRPLPERGPVAGAAVEAPAARRAWSAPTPRRPARPVVRRVDGLTGREIEIAHMVAARQSNKTIGQSLAISPRTVSTHLTHIYRKLDVTTRRELADYVSRHGIG
jgi:DNA-binding CsgD family transcriptional regulator/pSer/pThr/pTyr-binding forkhead associated (FHA) protein